MQKMCKYLRNKRVKNIYNVCRYIVDRSDEGTDSLPDIIYENPNIFDAESFKEWKEECPDEYLANDYENLKKMRLLRDQLVEETTLSERESEVVILRSDGYDYEDISSQLKISPSTAAEYGYRAKEKVHEAGRTISMLQDMDEEWFVEFSSRS